VKYHKQISSKIQGPERERAWSDFWDQSFERFEKERLFFKYLERYENTEERDHLVSAARKCSLYKTGTPVVVLKPVNEPFSQRTGNNLRNMVMSFGVGLCLWFIMIVIPGLHNDKVKKFRGTRKREIHVQLLKAYRTFKPTHGFIATPVILAANLLIFIIMVFMGLGFISFPPTDLLNWGGLYQPLVQKGQWWRILTSMFLHSGVMHVFMNMVSLYLAGIFLEALIGTKRFAAGYLVTGVLAALASIWWHDEPIVAVGASGAVFGLYGMLLSLIISRVLDPALNKILLILLGCTAGYSLFIGFAMEGIDNSAHVGGLIAGFAVGLINARKIKNRVALSELPVRDTRYNETLVDQD
jgi:membrane associated rhomboid family serine protease